MVEFWRGFGFRCSGELGTICFVAQFAHHSTRGAISLAYFGVLTFDGIWLVMGALEHATYSEMPNFGFAGRWSCECWWANCRAVRWPKFDWSYCDSEGSGSDLRTPQ